MFRFPVGESEVELEQCVELGSYQEFTTAFQTLSKHYKTKLDIVLEKVRLLEETRPATLVQQINMGWIKVLQ